MGGGTALPGWDTLILAIPFLGILALAMFGVDEHLATPRRTSRARRSFCEVDGEGGSFLSDPDGKPWRKPPVRQIEAQLIRTGAVAGIEPPPEPAPRPRRHPVLSGYIIEAK